MTTPAWRLRVEVKTPDLRSLAGGRRQENPWQLLARIDGVKQSQTSAMSGPITSEPNDVPFPRLLVTHALGMTILLPGTRDNDSRLREIRVDDLLPDIFTRE